MIATRLEDLAPQERQDHRQDREGTRPTNSPRAASRRRCEGRQKQPYSVWRKMERKSIAFEQLSDIFGFRVVVEDVEDCYRVIGVVHTKWAVVPGRFKDYISTPKQNDYQLDPHHRRRPRPPARRTSGAHPARCTTSPATASPRMRSIRTDASRDRETPDAAKAAPINGCGAPSICSPRATRPEEFLEHTKLELFHDQVFCFTPEGAAHRLAARRDADRFRLCGAYRRRQFRGRRQDQRPHRAAAVGIAEWRRGRDHARRRPDAARRLGDACRHRQGALRDPPRDAAMRCGRNMPGSAARSCCAPSSGPARPIRKISCKAALPRLARANIEDVLAAVGRGEMFSGDVVKAVYPEFKEERKAAPASARRSRLVRHEEGVGPGVQGARRGEQKHDAPSRSAACMAICRCAFAPNGGAVPGDRIVGILTPGEGITIYPIQSPALTAFDDQPERWLDVRWDVEERRP